MPCRDYYEDYPEEYYAQTIQGLKAQISFAESALCAAINVLESEHGENWIHKIDCQEAGIDPAELVKWRRAHQILDRKHRAERKKQAAASLRRKQKQEALLAQKRAIAEKLTAEEREALGIRL